MPCHTPDQTYRCLQYSFFAMKFTASPPKLLITVLMIPTLGDRNRINIPHMTMVEMKFGAYVMV